MQNKLTVKNLFKKYENKPLLAGVSFTVKEGETICLLGRSGSGKSTILRIIAGIEQPESGEVFWNQQNMRDIPVHQRNFGFMFQDYALFPHMNVFENVAFGLRMQNLPAETIREKVDAILRKVKMEQFTHRNVQDLSGGEQQRVALARAFAPEPKLMMLDEPLGALDRTLKEQLMDEIRFILHESNIPAIYVTHDQEEAFTIADRLVLLHDGQVVQDASPEEIYLYPHSSWVAEFLGLSNLMVGKILSVEPLWVETPLGNLKIEWQKVIGLQTGDSVTVLLRPDSLMIDDKEINVFPVKIKDQIYLGDQWKVKMMIGQYDFIFYTSAALKSTNFQHVSLNPKKINIFLDPK